MADFPYSGGALPSPDDSRDWLVLQELPNRAVAAPSRTKRVVLGNMPRVYDQGTTPQCVAYTAAGVAERMERDACNSSVAMGASAHYARCKELDGIPNADGTYPRVSNDVLISEGIPNTLGRGAPHFRFEAYYSVAPTFDAVAEVIDLLRQPVRMALRWPMAWTGSEGLVIEDAFMYGGVNEWTGFSHELWAYGYDLDFPAESVERGLYVRNSWGGSFGNKGNAVIPAEQLDGSPGPRRPLVTLFEAWWLKPSGWSRA
jgi:hypothetical protein